MQTNSPVLSDITPPAADSESRQLLLLSAGHFFNDFYCNFLPILLPLLMPKMGISLALSGMLVMALSFSANVMQPVLGYWMDKYNVNRLLPIIIPFGAIFICTTNYAPNFIVLFFQILLSGFAVSFFHPMGLGLVSKAVKKRSIGMAISVFVTGGNLGFALAPMLLVYFTTVFSLDFLPLLIIPAILLGILYQHTGLPRIRSVSVQSSKDMHFNFQSILHNRAVMKLNIAMGLRAWTYSVMATYLPLLLIQQYYSTAFGGTMLTIYLVGAAMGGLTGGWFNDRFGYKKTCFYALIFGFFPTAYFFLASEITGLSYVALFLSGAALQSTNPCSIVWGQRLLPANPNMASGMMMGLSFGLGGIGTALTAFLGEYIGLSSALLITSLTLLPSAYIIRTIPIAASTDL